MAVAVKNKVLVIYSVVHLCQLFVTRIRYLLCIYSSVLFVIIRSVFYSLFDYFVSSSLSFVLIVVQKKKNNSEPELCSGISIPLTVTRKQKKLLALPVTSNPVFNIIII
jgi:hypothetical protein